jgi:hypothetical protein
MAGGRDEGARAAATAARRRSSPAGQGLSWARVPSPVNDSRPSRPPSLSEPHSRGRTCTSLPVALARLVPLTISPLSPDQTPRHVEPPSSSTAAAAPLARIGPVAARRDQHCRHVGFGSVVPPPAERAQGLVSWRSDICLACRCAPCLPPRPHQCELLQADAGALLFLSSQGAQASHPRGSTSNAQALFLDGHAPLAFPPPPPHHRRWQDANHVVRHALDPLDDDRLLRRLAAPLRSPSSTSASTRRDRFLRGCLLESSPTGPPHLAPGRRGRCARRSARIRPVARLARSGELGGRRAKRGGRVGARRERRRPRAGANVDDQ